MSKITASANGEDCQVRYVGICTHDPDKTIWSHCRHGAAGKGLLCPTCNVRKSAKDPVDYMQSMGFLL